LFSLLTDYTAHDGMTALGWNPFYQRTLLQLTSSQEDATSLVPGRVLRENRQQYLVYTPLGELAAQVSGRLRYDAASRGDYPAVGDWVVVAPRADEGAATIHGILPRQSAFRRKVAGSVTEEQIVAANIETVFIVDSLERGVKLRLVERYLTLAWDSGATPVILLNKADVCDDVESALEAVREVAFGVPTFAVSALQARGLAPLSAYLLSGHTVALMGSSGVGKSTLINALLGEERLATGVVRDGDHKGRHTTSHRELVALPGGALLVDTPGMRELQLWTDGDGLSESFDDIETLAAQCRFADCQHRSEPGCAVREALETGALSEDRYRNYEKMQKELIYLEARRDGRSRQRSKARGKALSKFGRHLQKSSRKHRWDGE
jgi:ribosome biogenesis GTPase